MISFKVFRKNIEVIAKFSPIEVKLPLDGFRQAIDDLKSLRRS